MKNFLLMVHMTFAEQVVTLLRRRKSAIHATPILFVLLQRKTEETYQFMWEIICKHAPVLQTLTKIYIHMDFETANRNAINKVLPNAVVPFSLGPSRASLDIQICQRNYIEHQSALVQNLEVLATNNVNDWNELQEKFVHTWCSISAAFVDEYIFEGQCITSPTYLGSSLYW